MTQRTRRIARAAAILAVFLSSAGRAQTGAGVEIERRPWRLHPSIDVGLALKLEAVSVQGGLDPGGSTLANIDLLVDLDTERAGWWKGGSFHFYVLGDAGSAPSPSARAGDVQTARNIEAPDDIKLYEAYYQQRLFEGISFAIGLHDANTVFADIATASVFHHSSFGIQPDISQAGPSIFPVAGMGVVLSADLAPRWLLEAGVYDGVPGDPGHPRGTRVHLGGDDGLFSIAQLTWRPGGGIAGGGTDWALGGWYDTAPVKDPAGTDFHTNYGAYSTFERRMWAGSSGAELSAFAQVGFAMPERNSVERYLGAGVVWRGLSGGRPDDTLALAIGQARASSALRAAEPELPPGEIAVELHYSRAFAEGISLEPDFQYIRHPSAQGETRDARILALRLVLEF
jgi:porin